MKSRGIRNNNPLNIRHSADRWQGARMEQKDRSFVQFQSMAYGYRAAWKVLESYWKHFHRQRQPFTVESIIRRWAPPSENHTDAYVKTVLRLTSLGGNEHLPRPFTGYMLDKLARLMAAMTVMECGIPYEEDLLAYAAYNDKKEFVGICQFGLDQTGGHIRHLEIPGTDDADDALFVMGRAALNFIDLCGGKKTAAAKLLGIPRSSLYLKLQKYGIQ